MNVKPSSRDDYFKLIFDHHPDGILVIGPDNVVQFANQAASGLLRVPSKQLVGAASPITHIKDSSIFLQKDALPSTADIRCQLSELPPFNNVKTFLVTLQSEPLTSQVSSETKVEPSFAITSTESIELECVFSPNGKILQANSTFCNFIQREVAQIVGSNFFELLLPRDRINLEIQVAHLRPNAASCLVETQRLGHHQSPAHFLWSLHAGFDEQDRISEITAKGNPTSPWNQIESNPKLSLSIIDNAIEGILITDYQAKIISVNKAFTQMTGYRLEDVLGRDFSIFESSQNHPDLYQEINKSLANHGYWRGEIWNRRKNNEIFPANLTIVAVQPNQDHTHTQHVIYLQDITDIKNVEENLRYIAFHDPLTNLPNRMLFLNRLSHAVSLARRSHSQLAVLYLDLDMFKGINDTFGHDKGDILLQAVSERLLNLMRQCDTVARLGGDEFTILLEGSAIGSGLGASTVAQKVLETFSQPFLIDQNEFFITTSIGISIFPADGEDVTTLLKNADLAMYRAKEKGKNTFQFFSPELNDRAHKRMDIGNQLRYAQARNELRLVYQPIVDAHTRQPVSLEALLRWESTDLGKVFPNEFIPLAESNGLIVPIGEWVLRRACLDTQALIQTSRPNLQTSVNISGRQLQKDLIAIQVEEALKSSGLSPQNLTLEITETLLMENPEQTREILQYIRSLGVKVSIDDFGTGYSSLNSLTVLPIDILKIDKTFVAEIARNHHSLSLVQGIISIGHNLGLTVIAEGVETLEQAALLESNNCDELQGYLFSQPVSFYEAAQYLQRYSEPPAFSPDLF